MIARLWHGRVPSVRAREYRQFLMHRAIPDYRSIPGNLAVQILERPEGEITHFITLTHWDAVESIKQFAGEQYEQAKYYAEDHDFLLEFEPLVKHYTVVGKSGQ